jgi:hypothetical protein
MRRRWAATAFAVALIWTMVPAAVHARPRLQGVPAFGHVFLIIGENTTLSQLDAKDAPFQTGFLRRHSAWLTDYWGISHYSTSNYIAMTSGQFVECEQLDEKPATCNQDVPNLFSQLDAARISWKAWNESMPAGCYLVNAGRDHFGNSYAVKHNPAVYYEDIEGGDFSGTTGSASCATRVVPMGTTGFNDTSYFDEALASSKTPLPRFNYIVPNMCEDGHDNCQPQGNPIKQFDDFVSREFAKIVASPQWSSSNDLIIVTYDEGQDGGPGKAVKFAGGNVPFAVYGGPVANGLYGSTANHYGMLRTLEDGFGISTHLGGAATANLLGNIWKS